MKKILLTGGGTAGHVTPNLALVPYLRNAGYEIYYMGSEQGIERKLIEEEDIPYYSVQTGKLRRYWSSENLKDVQKVLKGIKQAKKIIKELKPDVVFSKGGFVAVPVVLAAKACRIPVIIHESDITPGLANKISTASAKVVCTTFVETLDYIPNTECVHTGSPIRKELFQGMKVRGLTMCGMNDKKPIILVMGGSLGSVKINKSLRLATFELLETFQIVHLCGEGNVNSDMENLDGYYQAPYISSGLENIYAMADIIVSRAGSNSICEFLALKKPNLLIPLSREVSRGDQILNAKSFEEQGYSMVLEEEDMIAPTLIEKIMDLYQNRNDYIQAMRQSDFEKGTEKILEQINRFS